MAWSGAGYLHHIAEMCTLNVFIFLLLIWIDEKINKKNEWTFRLKAWCSPKYSNRDFLMYSHVQPHTFHPTGILICVQRWLYCQVRRSGTQAFVIFRQYQYHLAWICQPIYVCRDSDSAKRWSTVDVCSGTNIRSETLPFDSAWHYLYHYCSSVMCWN